jgi:hypothetical protein
MQKLTRLDLSRTGVGDSGLSRIKDMKQLQSLDLPPAVSDGGLSAISGLTNLFNLKLSGEKITDAGLKCLVGLKKLQWLDLAKTKVTGAGVANFKESPHLYDVKLPKGTDAKVVEELKKVLPKTRIAIDQ